MFSILKAYFEFDENNQPPILTLWQRHIEAEMIIQLIDFQISYLSRVLINDVKRACLEIFFSSIT